VVDDLDRPVRPGEAGRVRDSTSDGPNGYLYDEEATRAFFKDGFFYPGDLAVLREDGRIALQGRVTDVINIKGHKVLPAPLEARLREALGVSDVCLFSMQDDHGEEQLHLMIEAPAPIDTSILVPVLRGELFGYPGAHVQFTARLPRNDTGKVVRREVVPTRKELLIRIYSRLCAKLAAVGLARLPYEGAEAYAGRVALQRPDLALAVNELCRQYSALRYAAVPAPVTVGDFEAAVRDFRPAAKQGAL